MARPRLAGLVPVLVITLFASAALAFTLWKDNRPFLGLDLQGGVSVVLKPKGDATDEQLNDAIRIMRQRIDSLGVAEPEITRQGDTILIQIPGVRDQQRAIELVGTTAEVRFRPVLAVLAPEGATVEPLTDPTASTVVVPGPDGTTPATDLVPPTSDPAAPAAPEPGAVTSTSAPVADAPPGTEQVGAPLALGEQAVGAQETPPSTVSDLPPAEPTPTGEVPPSSDTIPPEQIQQLQQQLQAQTGQQGGTNTAAANCPTTTTPPSEDLYENTVLLPYVIGGQQVSRLCLGPAQLRGTALVGATANLDQQGRWVVLPRFKGGADGIDQFNALAAQCYAGQPTCPAQSGQERGQVAITLDGRVVSAPEIQTPKFEADQVQISGSFSEREARDLATVLKYGALPIELERQASEQVSATLGRDALEAGLIAGAVGAALVAIYMLVWYRILGLLALFKLLVEAAILWSIISFMGTNLGLALTLAGVMGIIVSIGVSLDSNIVYYEHLREDVLGGRTLRSAVEKSFDSAFSTIVKADSASVIGAGVLYFLAVGPVRGFALLLGISTLLDLFTSALFMRPLVRAATRSSLAQRRPRMFGLPAGPEESSRRRSPAEVPAEVGA